MAKRQLTLKGTIRSGQDSLGPGVHLLEDGHPLVEFAESLGLNVPYVDDAEDESNEGADAPKRRGRPRKETRATE